MKQINIVSREDIEKMLEKHINDFLSGSLNTAKAPLYLIDYIDRVSGFKDFRDTREDTPILQEQALNESKIIKEGVKTFFTNEEARDLFWDIVQEDMKERPAYYAGGIVTGFGLGKMLLEKFTERIALATTLNTGKIEGTIHQLYEKGEMYTNQNQPKKQLSKQEIKDEVDKRVQEYIRENDMTSIQDIVQFTNKTREDLKNGTLTIENNQENREQNLKEEVQAETNNYNIQRR